MVFRFENCVLDTERRELRRGAAVQPIEPQVFDLLEYLIRNRERVVSRDELFKAIWNDRIVSEAALSTRINAVRNAIGDSGREQRLIRTVRQNGFRFIGTVHEEKLAIRAELLESSSNVDLTATPLERPAIAVLRLRHYNDNSDEAPLAEGITEDLITGLSKVGWFFVISHHSALTTKNNATDLSQIAYKLGVRYILDGSVRLIINRVFITANLIDGVSGRYLWSERYEQYLNDGLALRDQITGKIVDSIAPYIFSAEDIRAKCKSPKGMNAWECIVRALSLMRDRKKQQFLTATGLLRHAIAIDPQSAQAYSLLAYLITLSVHMGWKRPQAALPLALNLANKALSIDPDEPWAHASLGYTMIWKKRGDEAYFAIEKALALKPNFSMANYFSALCSSLLFGRVDEAFQNAERGSSHASIDLLSRGNFGVYNNVRSTASFVGERYREGIKFGNKAIIENPKSTPAYRPYIVNCALAGELDEAKVALQALKVLMPTISLQWIEETVPFYNTDHRKRYCEGFRLVGLK